jgi:SAM-dependent methyltransferase
MHEVRALVVTLAATSAMADATSIAPRPIVTCQIAAGQPAPGSGIYFAGTPESIADAMLTLAGVTKDDVVYDLGSGDGRIVVLAAQKYGARGVGVEIEPRLVAIARQVAREGEVENRATFIEGDLFSADISAATIVTLWLSPSMNADLEAKLRRELRPGARVVSRQFPIGRWAPDETRRVGGEPVFLWRVPLEHGGN